MGKIWLKPVGSDFNISIYFHKIFYQPVSRTCAVDISTGPTVLMMGTGPLAQDQ
jgi:hypothetical protein